MTRDFIETTFYEKVIDSEQRVVISKVCFKKLRNISIGNTKIWFRYEDKVVTKVYLLGKITIDDLDIRIIEVFL